jgi:hypothetical protein
MKIEDNFNEKTREKITKPLGISCDINYSNLYLDDSYKGPGLANMNLIIKF